MGTFVLIFAIPLLTIAVGLLLALFFRFLNLRRRQRQDLERRLRANWLPKFEEAKARAKYNARQDFAGSLDEGYAAIRERMRNGGAGWERGQ